MKTEHETCFKNHSTNAKPDKFYKNIRSSKSLEYFLSDIIFSCIILLRKKVKYCVFYPDLYQKLKVCDIPLLHLTICFFVLFAFYFRKLFYFYNKS